MREKTRKIMVRLKNSNGMVFIVALGMMFILLSLGIAYLAIMRSETRISTNEVNALKAFYFAEAGVEHAMADIRQGNSGSVFGDMDADAMTDYLTSVAGNMIQSDSYVNPTNATRAMEVVFSQNPFTGALQAGNNITNSGGTMTGTIGGNVDAGGAVDTGSMTIINGTVTSGNTVMAVPSPTMANYMAIADYFSCATLDVSNPPSGIYYITGSCTISAVSNFNLNGTIVVDGGTLLLNQMLSSLTINPGTDAQGKKYPAIIVNGNLTINQAFNVTINGLIYATQNVSFSAWPGSSTINGAVVSRGDAGANLDMASVDNLTVAFDPTLDPPYFSGGAGGYMTAASWKGHQ